MGMRDVATAALLLAAGCRVERVDVVVPVSDGGASDAKDAMTTAVPPSVLVAEPSSWDFGEIEVESAPSIGISITRTQRPASAAPIDLVLDDPDRVFVISDGCDATNERQECKLSLGVRADAALGARKATLRVSSADATSAIVPLAVQPSPAQGRPAFLYAPDDLTFAGSPVGRLAERMTVKVTNVGDGRGTPVPTIKAVDAASSFAYAIANTNCDVVVSPGATCTLDVAFRPYALTAHEAVLFDVQAKNPSSVRLLGKGLPDPFASDLVALWRFDESNGSALQDDSGRGNVAKLVTPGLDIVARDRGFVGSALLAAKDVWATAPGAGFHDLEARGQITVSAWINRFGLDAQPRWIVAKAATDTKLPELGLSLDGDEAVGWVMGQSCRSQDRVAPRIWTHVALTFDGSNLMVFVDGIRACGVAVDTPYRSKDEPVTIGARPTPIGVPDGIFGGHLDELRIYARALTRDEIFALAAR